MVLTAPEGDQPEAAEIEPAEPAPAPSHTAETVPAEQTPAASSELKALVGKNVTIEANEGPRRTGILQAVADDHLTLSVPLGAGNMEYFYDIDSIRHIEAAR